MPAYLKCKYSSFISFRIKVGSGFDFFLLSAERYIREKIYSDPHYSKKVN